MGMKLRRVQLNDFRTYARCCVELGPQANVFFGKNAQGKTNFLESVRLMSIGKSMRAVRDKEMVRWGAEAGKTSALVRGRNLERKVEISLFADKPKTVKVDGCPISRMGELMGVIATVLFTPDEIGIVKNSPADRRRFVDISLCQLSKAYFYALTRYNKILSQRNALLKSGRADENSLIVWDMQLAKEGARIAKSRMGFTKQLEEFTAEAHAYLSGGSETLTLSYEGITGEDADEICNKMIAKLKEDRERDRKQCYTHSGIQTDDLKVEINGIDVRKFGSQGQQRTAALSLKLAEAELFFSQTGEYPILLLDDVFSELDKTRQERLLERIAPMQSVITCTHFDFALPEGARVFEVNGGAITPRTPKTE